VRVGRKFARPDWFDTISLSGDTEGFAITVLPRMVADYQASRQSGSWPGLYAERVQISPAPKYQFGFKGPVHLLCASEGHYRTAGETRVDDLKSARCLAVRETMVLVPCGSTLSGWSQLKQISSWFYIYIDPKVVDAALGPSTARLRPRLFFNDARLADTVRKVRSLVSTPHELAPLHAQTLAILLYVEMLSGAEGFLAGSKTRSGLSLHAARLLREYIDAEISSNPQIAELSALVDLSPYYFMRAFKQTFGVPPHQYVMRCRIERAKRMIQEGRQPIAEIAGHLGFSSASHFSTAFKAIAGESPSQFRRFGGRRA
jgi:AraC family transcriptional regulator